MCSGSGPHGTKLFLCLLDRSWVATNRLAVEDRCFKSPSSRKKCQEVFILAMSRLLSPGLNFSTDQNSPNHCFNFSFMWSTNFFFSLFNVSLRKKYIKHVHLIFFSHFFNRMLGFTILFPFRNLSTRLVSAVHRVAQNAGRPVGQGLKLWLDRPSKIIAFWCLFVSFSVILDCLYLLCCIRIFFLEFVAPSGCLPKQVCPSGS